jgi:uncharacterized OB-fold protein
MSSAASERPLLPTRAPRANHETAAFWEGCLNSRLVLPRCDGCGELIWYPRRFCPFCASTEVTDVAVSGRGTIYSFTVIRKGVGPFSDAAPYVLAYVELEEGPRIQSNIIGVDPETVHVGQPVRVVFEPVYDPAKPSEPPVAAIYRFAPS